MHDLRELLRKAIGKKAQPTAVIYDGRTLQSSVEAEKSPEAIFLSGERAGYDGHKKKRGSKVHMAVDTLGNLLALLVTPANEQERAQVAELSRMVQEATGQNVDIAYVDQGYTGEQAERAAKSQGIDLSVVKLEEAKKGFVLLPRRWVHSV